MESFELPPLLRARTSLPFAFISLLSSSTWVGSILQLTEFEAMRWNPFLEGLFGRHIHATLRGLARLSFFRWRATVCLQQHWVGPRPTHPGPVSPFFMDLTILSAPQGAAPPALGGN
jgi:hypothetical protein